MTNDTQPPVGATVEVDGQRYVVGAVGLPPNKRDWFVHSDLGLYAEDAIVPMLTALWRLTQERDQLKARVAELETRETDLLIMQGALERDNIALRAHAVELEERLADAELIADGGEVFEDSAKQERQFDEGGVQVRYVGPWMAGEMTPPNYEDSSEVTPRLHDYLRTLGRQHVKRAARTAQGGA